MNAAGRAREHKRTVTSFTVPLTTSCGIAKERPVLYADSEGGAALIAIGLPELLRLLLVAPWWSSCTAFTADESRALAAEYLQDIPDLAQRRDRAASLLGLELPSEQAALQQLRAGCARPWQGLHTDLHARGDRIPAARRVTLAIHGRPASPKTVTAPCTQNGPA